MLQVAVIGVGGWGKNLARNFSQLNECTLRYICDLDDQKLAQMQALVPGAIATNNYHEALADQQVKAVVIATPAPSHYELAKKVIESNKDVYVEKPMVLDINHAQHLINLATERDRVLMVGHLLEYHPVINELKRLIECGDLGRVLYVYNQRVNLGTVREDENALWNFAPHDISVILYLLGKEPIDVAAHGQSYLKQGIEDVVFLTMKFSDQTMAHIHVSWLDPHKIRQITVVGDKKMAVFNDLESNEKLRVYDKGASYNTHYDTFAEYVNLRFGDIVIPYVKVGEPLRHECQHFLECVRTRKQPLSDGWDGLRVVKVLDAAQQSLRNNGQPIKIDSSHA